MALLLRAGVGKVFHHYVGKFDFHQRVYMLFNFKEILGEFVFHYLKENFYKVALEGGAKSTVDSLRMPVFLNFLMTIPPIDEQKIILDSIKARCFQNDQLFEAYARQLTLLTEYRAALIHECVTGQRPLPDPSSPDGGTAHAL
jgi:type I restriction enzyme, S subunit